MTHHDLPFQPGPRGRRFRPEWPDDDGIDGPGTPGRRGHGGPRGFGGHHGGGFPGGPGGFPGGPGGFPGGPGGFPGGRPGGRRGGPRARGDVRAAVLLLLDEQPRHGYDLIQEITERSSGAWTPSPGSVYPTLQALEDEGLVTLERVDGRRTASLTPEGQAHVDEHRERLGNPWTPTGSQDSALAFREEFLTVRDAVRQVARVGTPAQHAAAAAALTAARKELYRILAEDAPTEQ